MRTPPTDAERGPFPRVAKPGERGRVVDILVDAFYDDPTWAWAFPDPHLRRGQQRRLWQLTVQGAARYPASIWLNTEATATAVWIPPGGTELSPEQESALDDLLTELLGADAGRLTATFDAFTAARPPGDDFYYLTMLGTDPAHRGHGAGLRLLEDTLGTVDAEGAAAYLEASNPVNVALYARYGFHPRSTFTLPCAGPAVTTMWRNRAR